MFSFSDYVEQNESSYLNAAGIYLRNCMLAGKSFPSDGKYWKEQYIQSVKLRQSIMEKIKSSKTVLLAGAGPGSKHLPEKLLKDPDIFKIGVNFTFYLAPECFDLTIATHSPVIQCAAIRTPTMATAHAVYSKTPPIVNNSFTFGWADPRFQLKRIQSPEEIILTAQQTNKAFSSGSIFPMTWATRNIFFISLMLLISGLQENSEIIISGFDPEASGYYSTGNTQINDQIIEDLLKSNHSLNAWDGRHERINLSKMSNQMLIRQFSMTNDSIKLALYDSQGLTFKRNLVPEFLESFEVYINAVEKRKINLSYIGESGLCEKAGLKLSDRFC